MNEQFNNPAPSPRSIIKREDGLLAYYFSAQIANIIVRACRPLGLRPNHYTLLSLVTGIIAAWFVQKGDYPSLLWGMVILHVSFIFDCADGQCARLTNTGSLRGHWFDYESDKIKDGLLLIAIAAGAYHASGNTDVRVFILAFAALFFQFLRNIIALNRDIFSLEKRGHRDTMHSPLAKPAGTTNQFKRSLRHSLLFKLSDRVFLFTLFAMGNAMWSLLFVYAALEALYALASSALTVRLFRRFDHHNTTL